jgi:hypothetical protein
MNQEAMETAVAELLREAMLRIRFELAPLQNDLPPRQRMRRAWILADLCTTSLRGLTLRDDQESPRAWSTSGAHPRLRGELGCEAVGTESDTTTAGFPTSQAADQRPIEAGMIRTLCTTPLSSTTETGSSSRENPRHPCDEV